MNESAIYPEGDKVRCCLIIGDNQRTGSPSSFEQTDLVSIRHMAYLFFYKRLHKL